MNALKVILGGWAAGSIAGVPLAWLLPPPASLYAGGTAALIASTITTAVLYDRYM